MKSAAVIAASILSLFLIVFLTSDIKNTNISDNTETAITSVLTETPSAGSTYTLKEYNGKLAVFEADSQEPFEVFSILVSTLPAEDRDMLKAGIVAQSREELQRLVEDYTG